MSNKIKITVGGISYSVSGDESEEYMHQLGDELENKMKSIVRRNPYLSTTMVAIMTALESCDEAKKAKSENERLKNSIKSLEKTLESERNRYLKYPDKKK